MGAAEKLTAPRPFHVASRDSPAPKASGWPTSEARSFAKQSRKSPSDATPCIRSFRNEHNLKKLLKRLRRNFDILHVKAIPRRNRRGRSGGLSQRKEHGLHPYRAVCDVSGGYAYRHEQI